jgi:hypothetical protein
MAPRRLCPKKLTQPELRERRRATIRTTTLIAVAIQGDQGADMTKILEHDVTGAGRDYIRGVLAELTASGQLHRKGTGHGTRYYVIQEEKRA